MAQEFSIDALLPAEMAQKAEAIGVRKAAMGPRSMFMLSVLAGGFIAMGAIFCTTVLAGSGTLPYGVARILGGVAFCLGLILVVVGGAELFTGNNLIVMAWASGKVTTASLLRNWTIVYLGNLVGSLGTAVMVFLSKQYLFGGGSVGLTALNIANAKVGLDFVQAIALGVLCNILVCLAVWMTFSARSTMDKIAAIVFPISAFVAAGFEHSIANMYFIPYAIMVKDFGGSELWPLIGKTAADYAGVTWGSFLFNNLLPVTIGNVIGGGLMVAAVYWSIFLRKKHVPVPATTVEKAKA